MALIIDDDVMLRVALAELLDEEGFDVAQASNGFSGLRQAAELHPRLIVLDLMLPELSGMEVLREIRAHFTARDVAVVVVTGSPERLTEEQRAEADAVVRKPFDVSALLSTIHRAVQRARTRATEVQPTTPPLPAAAGHVELRLRRRPRAHR
jgi:DNA-binding response OmpR family regulator